MAGEEDFNRDNTRETFEHGFRLNGFKQVQYLEVPGMKHTMPEVKVLKEALQYLTEKEKLLSIERNPVDYLAIEQGQ